MSESPPAVLGERRAELARALWAELASRRDRLASLLERCSGYAYDDVLYRFWHWSAKVFSTQELTEQIVDLLCECDPYGLLRYSVERERQGEPVPFFEEGASVWFARIVVAGTGHEFQMPEDNEVWYARTKPIVDGFLYARSVLAHALDAVADPRIAEAQILPLPWAAVLEVYGLR